MLKNPFFMTVVVSSLLTNSLPSFASTRGGSSSQPWKPDEDRSGAPQLTAAPVPSSTSSTKVSAEELVKLRAEARDNKNRTQQFSAISKLWYLNPEERLDYVPTLLNMASTSYVDNMIPLTMLWQAGGSIQDTIRPRVRELAMEPQPLDSEDIIRRSSIRKLRTSDNPEDRQIVQEVLERLSQSSHPADQKLWKDLTRYDAKPS